MRGRRGGAGPLPTRKTRTDSAGSFGVRCESRDGTVYAWLPRRILQALDVSSGNRGCRVRERALRSLTESVVIFPSIDLA